MKLSNTNIAIILAATVASNVQAATPERTTEEAQSALLDYKAELKLSPRIFGNSPSFYPAYSACLRAGTNCINEFDTFRSSYFTYKNGLKAKLEKQIEDFEVLCRSSNESKCKSIESGANVVIRSEINDLEAGSDAISLMEPLKGLGGFTGRSGGVDAKMTVLKSGEKPGENIFGTYTILAPRLGSESVAQALNSDSIYRNFTKKFSRYLMAIKLFRSSPNSVSQDGVDLRDFVRPDFKSELAKINVPAGRFSVMPLDASMNIEALRRNNPNVSAEDLAKILIANYRTFKSRYIKTSVKAEVNILTDTVNVVLASVNRDAADRTITFELFKDRLTVLERSAEGIIASLNSGRPMDTDTITKYVKMWMYAKQIVGENETANVLFGTIEMPAPIEPEPVVKVAEPADGGRSRSSSTASTDSTSSTSSTKSFLSYFGF